MRPGKHGGFSVYVHGYTPASGRRPSAQTLEKAAMLAVQLGPQLRDSSGTPPFPHEYGSRAEWRRWNLVVKAMKTHRYCWLPPDDHPAMIWGGPSEAS